MSDPTEERRRPVCAIAGVGPGNGEAFARRFAAEGYSVALLARNKERLETLAGELPEARAFRLFACGAIRPRLEIAVRRARHGVKRKTSDMNDEFASQSLGAIAPGHDTSSPSSHLLDELASHGYRPLDDERDPRPLPSSDAASLALESAVEALSSLFLDTRLETELPEVLWFFVNLFHRNAQRVNRELDDNEPRSGVRRRKGLAGNPLGRT